MYREIPSIYRVQYNLGVRHVLRVLEHIPWGYRGTTLLPSMMHRPKLNFSRNILKRSINWNLPKAVCPNGLYYAIMNKYSKTIEHLPLKGDWGLHIIQFITLPSLERWYLCYYHYYYGSCFVFIRSSQWAGWYPSFLSCRWQQHRQQFYALPWKVSNRITWEAVPKATALSRRGCAWLIWRACQCSLRPSQILTTK